MGITTNNGNVLPTLPIGTMVAWPNSVAPYGWLLANGSAQSRTLYADLFALYGTKYGVGDGSTTFNLPNIPLGANPWTMPRGRVGYTAVTSQVTGVGTTAADLASVTFTAVANRRYLITAYVSTILASSVTGEEVSLIITDSVNAQINQTRGSMAVAGKNTPGLQAQAVVTPSAGSVTYKMRGRVQSGTVGFFADSGQPMYIMVEDIGADVTAAPNDTGSWIVRARNVAVNIDASTFGVATSGSLPAAVLGRTVYTTDDHKLLIADGTTPVFRPPWNLPWGMFPTNAPGETALVGVVARTSNQATITTQVDITGMTLTWTAVAGRRYMYFVSCEILPTVADGAYVLALTDGSNVTKQRATGPCLSTGASQTIMMQFSEDFATTALVTRKIRLSKASGTGSLTMTADPTYPAYMHIIDMGPITNPA